MTANERLGFERELADVEATLEVADAWAVNEAFPERVRVEVVKTAFRMLERKRVLVDLLNEETCEQCGEPFEDSTVPELARDEVCGDCIELAADMLQSMWEDDQYE